MYANYDINQIGMIKIINSTYVILDYNIKPIIVLTILHIKHINSKITLSDGNAAKLRQFMGDDCIFL